MPDNGKNKRLSRTARYYRRQKKNGDPKGVLKRKKSVDTSINSRPEQIRKRVESNGKRAKAKRRGMNVKGKDYDHSVNRFRVCQS